MKKSEILPSNFKLPSLSELIKKFDIEPNTISNIDDIRIEISDSLFELAEKVIEPILSGENFASMIEQQLITNEEMEKLMEIYKKIQSLKWENNILSIKTNKNSSAKCIRKMWELWNSELENDLIKICKKLSEEWEKIDFNNETEEHRYND